MTVERETGVRVKTAAVGAALLLAVLLFGGHFGASVVTALLAGVMSWEMSRVFYRLPDFQEKTKALLGSAWLMVFVNILFPKSGLECLIAAFVGMFAYFLVTAERHPQALKEHFEELIYSVFILVYVVLFMEFLPLIRRGPNGVFWLLMFLAVNWAGDSAAYFVGRRYGRRKLYPLVSPGKTIEGAVGGLAGSILAALLFKWLAFRELSHFGALFTGFAVGIFAQIGDLCESLFKRAYGLKDSGRILPGHGGVLDRFDGILFSLPVMYLCVRLFA